MEKMEKIDTDREDWHGLNNDELEKLRLNFSRCVKRDIAPLNLYLSDAD